MEITRPWPDCPSLLFRRSCHRELPYSSAGGGLDAGRQWSVWTVNRVQAKHASEYQVTSYVTRYLTEEKMVEPNDATPFSNIPAAKNAFYNLLTIG
jgi:hypothetical protein